jgi:imidazolonepropionase-like amidohydrolase
MTTPVRTLVVGGTVIDGSGAEPRKADVLLEGDRISRIVDHGSVPSADLRVVDASGATVMPGLIEAHAHLGFGSTVDRPENCMPLSAEEGLLRSLHAGKVLLDAGFTSAYSAGNRRPQQDVLLKSEFAGGWFPGPRMRAASWEGSPDMVSQGGSATSATEVLTQFVNEMADLGVDTLKVSLTGESGVVPYSSRLLTFTEEQVAAIATAARSRNLWLSAHAHAAEGVKRAVRHGFRVIYHATWTDEEAMDLLEAARDRIFVGPAPGINWANLNEPDAPPATEQEETVEQVKRVMPELKARGIRVLPGGDYGFFWNPIGRNARDLTLFQDWFGFSPMEVLVAATKWGGELMDLPVGQLRPDYFADLLVVQGDPLDDLSVLTRPENLAVIMKGGAVHRADAGRLTSARA